MCQITLFSWQIEVHVIDCLISRLVAKCKVIKNINEIVLKHPHFIMEAIPEDLKADLAKEANAVEVILGETFRVWFDGQRAQDYWVRMTPDGLKLSPTRMPESSSGLCCHGK